MSDLKPNKKQQGKELLNVSDIFKKFEKQEHAYEKINEEVLTNISQFLLNAFIHPNGLDFKTDINTGEGVTSLGIDEIVLPNGGLVILFKLVERSWADYSQLPTPFKIDTATHSPNHKNAFFGVEVFLNKKSEVSIVLIILALADAVNNLDFYLKD